MLFVRLLQENRLTLLWDGLHTQARVVNRSFKLFKENWMAFINSELNARYSNLFTTSGGLNPAPTPLG